MQSRRNNLIRFVLFMRHSTKAFLFESNSTLSSMRLSLYVRLCCVFKNALNYSRTKRKINGSFQVFCWLFSHYNTVYYSLFLFVLISFLGLGFPLVFILIAAFVPVLCYMYGTCALHRSIPLSPSPHLSLSLSLSHSFKQRPKQKK